MSARVKGINAVLLSVLMVISVAATGAIGVAGATTVQDDRIDDATAHDPADVAIDPALESAEGEERVILLLEQASIAPGTDRTVATNRLQEHAAETQRRPVTQAGELRGVEVRNTFWIVNAVAITVDTDRTDVNELAAIEGVRSIVKSREYTVPEPADSGSGGEVGPHADGVTYGLDQIDAPEVWSELGTRGEGAKVAVLDTGVDITHPDIDLYTEDPSDPTYPGGWAEFDDNGDQVPGSEPHDTHYHGTHTSGTATGAATSGTAIGVAPEADLMHGLVIPGGSGTMEGVIGGVQWAVAEDADVVSLSLGAGCSLFNPGPVYDDAWIPVIENTRNLGTTFVSSSGNGGEGCVGSPGTDYNSFSIGASDENEDIAEFSSGMEIDKSEWTDPPEEWPDTFVKPDVSAPGDAVLSAEPGGTYQELSGTSMAAPHVAGTVALMRSANPDATVQEIEGALEATAWKPDDWSEPGDVKDTRYGLGIVDAYAAVDEMIFVPDYELGDVDEDASVDVQDVRLTQRHLAGQNPENFNENLADLNRDGSVTHRDLNLLQRKVQGRLAEGEIDVSNLQAPGEAEQGETINVTADLENLGDEGALDEIELHVAENESDLGDGEPVSTTPVDMAPEGVDSPVDRPHETTVTFQVDTAELPGGALHYGVFSEDDSASGEITILGSYFEVSNLQAPDEAEQGDVVNVTATVENTGNLQDTQTVEYGFDGAVEDTENVTLAAGESTTVAFDLDTSDIGEGTYEHGIATADDSAATNLTVLEAFFDVNVTDAPDEAGLGETINVTATVENTGNATDEQTVSYDLVPQEVDVAVVDVSDREHGDNIASTLEGHLDPDIYDVDVVTADQLPGAMDEYDTFVVQRFGSDQVASDFLAELDDGQSAVYLDSYQGASSYAYADGVYRLHNVRGDPADRDASTSSSSPTTIEIHEDHPIFDGVGEPGDSVEMYTGSTIWGSWFGDYSGTVLADAEFSSSSGGPSVAVNDDENEILLTAVGRDFFTDEEDFTEEGNLLLANSVAYLSGFGSAADGATIAQDDTSANVTLAPGESATVEFTHTIDDELDVSIDWLHTVNSEDDVDRTPITIDVDRGTVDGTVLDGASGEPVEGSTVEIATEIDGDHTDVTDENGEYGIEGVPAGTHNVTVSADGYDAVTGTVDVPVNDTATVDFELEPTPGSVSGTVTASDTGEPVANVTVVAEDDSGNVYEATTDGNGEYGVEVPPSTYVVNVGDTPGDYAPDEIVTVEPGEAVEGVDFTVEPRSGAIEGYVTNAVGVPIEGASVLDADQGEFNATTDENGFYRIDGLDRGTYALRTTHGSYPDSDITFVDVAANETTAQNLTLGTFFEVSALDAPAEAEQGETINVTATVTNLGEQADTRTVFYFPPGTDFGGDALPASDLSEEVNLDGGESATVTFTHQIEADRAPGEYEHGVSADEVESTFITVTEPEQPAEANFAVAGFDAPAEAQPGEELSVSATVTNTGTAPGNQTVEYLFDGAVEGSEAVSLDAGENATVTFTHAVPSEVGTYEHGVETDDDQWLTNVSVAEPEPAYFQVSDLTGPDEAEQGSEIEVNATITNTGDEAGTQTIWLFFLSASDAAEHDLEALGAREMMGLYRPQSSQQVSLDGGESTTVTFTYLIEEEPGDYNYSVSTLQETGSGAITVTTSGGNATAMTDAGRLASKAG